MPKINIPTAGFTKQDMAAVIASTLIIGLLVNFFEESIQVSGWTEVRNPNDYFYRGLAKFAYLDQKKPDHGGFSYLVTQARWKVCSPRV